MNRTAHYRFPSARWLPCLLLLLTSGVAAQEPEWLDQYQGPSSSANGNIGKGICVAPGGDLIATGQVSVDSNGGSDMPVLRISPAGERRWERLFHGGAFDMGYAVTADAQGNAYVAGESRTSNGNRFTVLSVDAAGQQRWVYHWAADTALMAGFDIIIAADGNIYATGVGRANPNREEAIVAVSLTTAGLERWRYAFDDPRNQSGVGWSIAADAQSNVYIAGRAGKDAAIVSLDASGGQRWIRRFHGSQGGIFADNTANEVIVGGDGHLYVAGKTDEIGQSRDLFAASLTTSGALRWSYRYTGTAGAADVGTSVAWGSEGNVYVGGKSVERNVGDAMIVIGLTSSGAERWRAYHAFSAGVNGVNSVGVNASGRVYACGWANNPSSRATSFGVLALTTSGEHRYAWQSAGFTGTADEIVIGPDGGAYAVGFVGREQGNTFLTVAAFDSREGYRLIVEATCPQGGAARVTWTGAPPNRTQGVVVGLRQGTTNIPSGPCVGTALGVAGSVRLVHTLNTGTGSGTLNARAGAGACGRWVQLVAVADPCATSNVARIE